MIGERFYPLGIRKGSLVTSTVASIFLLSAVFLPSPRTASAQVSTASANGTVTDTSGGVVPGAKIVLHNDQTGVDRSATTNEVGRYVFVNIPPGEYTIRASKQGFRTSEQTHSTLAVNQTATFNFELSVGAVTQAVTVQASAAKLEASTAELGTVVTSSQVTDLPLNGRNFTQLLALTPGVSPVNVAQTFGVRSVGTLVVPSVNGQNNRSNLFLLDGVLNQGSINSTFAVEPILDDIQEFKVQSHSGQAKYGGVLGGVVNVVTKSGTNHFHGALWEFLRNNALDARSPFVKTVEPFRQNEFGGDVGGPVILPHYNGRNRTFFFFGYQAYRRRFSGLSLFRTPTPADLNGDMSDLGAPIYNPFSTTPDPNNPGQFLRDPFPNNQVSSQLLDPTAVAFAKAFYPAPVDTGVAGRNGAVNTQTRLNSDEYNIRVDQQVGNKDSFMFRFSRFLRTQTNLGDLIGSSNFDDYPAHNIAANWVHTFSPTAVLQINLGRITAYTNVGTSVDGSDQLIPKFSQTLDCGFKGSRSCLLPNISIAGFLSGGEATTVQGISDIWEGRGNLTKIHGNHTFDMGFSIATNNIAETIINNGAAFAALQSANLESPGGTGSALASFLLGVPDSASRRNLVGGEQGGYVYGFYFQDQWKARRNLTINMGLRYDLDLIPQFGSSSDRTNATGTLDLNNGTYILQNPSPLCSVAGSAPCIPDAEVVPGTGLPARVFVSPNGKVFHNRFKNWGPHLGLAYSLNPKTVIRAAGGINYDEWFTVSQYGQSISGTWPTVTQFLAQNLNQDLPTISMENPLLTAGTLPAPTPFSAVNWYKDPFIEQPYSEQWNFGVQRQVSTDTVMTMNYVGSHSSRLNIGAFRNVAVTPGPGTPQDRAPYPFISPTFYDRSEGRSSYNAFEFSLHKTASRGLSYLISYTWAKSLDIGCSGFAGVEGCSVQDPYNLKRDRSVSAFDLTHNFSGSWVYQLPVGAGQPFQTHNKVLDYVIGPWQLNGILTLSSGIPYSVGISGDIANTGESGSSNGFGYERLNLVGDPNLSNPTTAEWFNTAAFAVPDRFTFGNTGRNILRTDWFKGLDLSIFRQFPITESKRLVFRAEFFNSTNTPVWGRPTNNRADSNFGRIFGTDSTERQIQMALKLYF
jgi:outer membrane receptor protein involved in Fe transport